MSAQIYPAQCTGVWKTVIGPLCLDFPVGTQFFGWIFICPLCSFSWGNNWVRGQRLAIHRTSLQLSPPPTFELSHFPRGPKHVTHVYIINVQGFFSTYNCLRVQNTDAALARSWPTVWLQTAPDGNWFRETVSPCAPFYQNLKKMLTIIILTYTNTFRKN